MARKPRAPFVYDPEGCFEALRSHDWCDTPARRLAVAVLERALLDAQLGEGHVEAKKFLRGAQDWIADDQDNPEWPFTFAGLCDALGLDRARVRRLVDRKTTLLRSA